MIQCYYVDRHKGQCPNEATPELLTFCCEEHKTLWQKRHYGGEGQPRRTIRNMNDVKRMIEERVADIKKKKAEGTYVPPQKVESIIDYSLYEQD